MITLMTSITILPIHFQERQYLGKNHLNVIILFYMIGPIKWTFGARLIAFYFSKS